MPTAQFLGRLVTHMLEPETDDNVVYWNTMDAWLPRPAPEGEEETPRARDEPPEGVPARFRRESGPPVVPIFKLMAPTPLPAKVLGEEM